MRILWVTGRRFGHDLCQTTQINLSKEMIEHGHDVHFLCPGESQPENDIPQVFHTIGRKLPRGMKGLGFEYAVRRRVGKLLDDVKPDVVICDWRGAIGACKILREKEIPWYLIDRGPPAYPGIITRFQWLFYRSSWKKALKYSEGNFVVSENHRDFIHSRYGRGSPVVAIPAGFDPELFDIEGSSSGEEPLRFVYHGRLDRKRRVLETVTLVEKLREKGLDARLRLVGEGDQWKKLQQLSIEREWMELTAKVKQSEIPAILAEMDVGLLPMGNEISWNTASPIKLFEYAASGLVVLATDIPAHKINETDEWLKIIPSEEFTDKGSQIFLDMKFRKQVKQAGCQARLDAFTNHTWRISAELMLSEMFQTHET